MSRTYKYKCNNPAHENCLGPTGVFILAICVSCKGTCHTNTCWQKGRRVSSDVAVLCEPCSGQGVLL